jgi:hypothetical protein
MSNLRFAQGVAMRVGFDTLKLCIPDPVERADWLSATLDVWVQRCRGRIVEDSILYGFEGHGITNEDDKQEIKAFFEALVSDVK